MEMLSKKSLTISLIFYISGFLCIVGLLGEEVNRYGYTVPLPEWIVAFGNGFLIHELKGLTF